jgi:hypothetical protein
MFRPPAVVPRELVPSHLETSSRDYGGQAVLVVTPSSQGNRYPLISKSGSRDYGGQAVLDFDFGDTQKCDLYWR